MTSFNFRSIIEESSEIKTVVLLNEVVKCIVTDFRTNCNKKIRKELKMYERYVALRDSKNITDYKVALDTGITRSTFTDWKSGRSEPKIDKLKRLADYFGVPLEYFLEE